MEAGSARRGKLELLVRRDDDEGFEVQSLSSSAAWINMRPHRVAPESCELAEFASSVDHSRGFILRNTRTDRYLLLTEEERFLWDHMDGHSSIQDIATAYVVKYGQFDFAIIPSLIRKLQRAQLLELRPTSWVRGVIARNRRQKVFHAAETALTALERINISSRKVHWVFEGLYRWGGVLLFTRGAVAACLLLAVLGIGAGVRLWSSAENVAAGLGAHPVMAVLAVKILFILTVGAHQLVHGLALVHYGRSVREFGFTFLHGFVPTFFVDITDIFMASRRARIVTAIAGTVVHLVLGSLWFMLATTMSPGFLQAFAAASGMIQWQAFIVSLYPFALIEMDGYHVLVDWLGVPTLKQDALAYVGGLFRGSGRLEWSRETGLWLGYVGLSTLSIGAFIAFNVWLIVHATH